MRRLYFLTPSIDSARDIVNELLLNHVEERHIHVLAKDDHALQDADLPQAGLMQQSDFVPAVERGLAVGGATGTVAGVAAVILPGIGLAVGGGAILGTALAGAGVGAWISSLIGVSLPNSRLKEFEKAIEDGQVLIMIDVPKNRVDDVTELVSKHHSEAEVEGTEPTVPPFP